MAPVIFVSITEARREEHSLIILFRPTCGSFAPRKKKRLNEFARLPLHPTTLLVVTLLVTLVAQTEEIDWGNRRPVVRIISRYRRT